MRKKRESVVSREKIWAIKDAISSPDIDILTAQNTRKLDLKMDRRRL